MQQRIQKIIAQSGLFSRRQAENLITQGRVRLNDRVAVLGDKAGSDDRIYVDDQQVISDSDVDVKVLLLNKPEGYICSRKDPGSRKSVFELLPDISKGRWIGVGRLDLNTSGLLLFTTDGELANRLMHPSSNIEREYMCRIFGEVNNNKINKLKKGVKLDSDKSVAFFKDVTRISSSARNHWFKVVLTQGRYREVRRLWQSVDCRVNRLSRIRFGDITLPKNLPKGECLHLTTRQIKMLRKSINV